VLIVLPGFSAVCLRIESPNLCTRIRVERNHSAGRRRKIEHSIDDERCGFERRNATAVRRVALSVDFACVVSPGSSKMIHIFTAYLRQGREAHSARVATVIAPFLCRAAAEHTKTSEGPEERKPLECRDAVQSISLRPDVFRPVTAIDAVCNEMLSAPGARALAFSFFCIRLLSPPG